MNQNILNIPLRRNVPKLKRVQETHADHGDLKTFGFWLYLMSDLILFSALFATFSSIGFNYANGPRPADLFHLPYLFAQTMLLLVSSFTFGLASIFAQQDKKRQTLISLGFTFLLGLGFIVMEVREFAVMIHENAGPDRSGFLSAFFSLVGCHGLHVAIGLIWLAVMMIQVIQKGFTAGVNSRLTRLSLFWHFLDIVWVGVFTFVYIIGML